jgi:hypothetical protein
VHRINREARIHHDLRRAGRTRLRPVIMAHTGTSRGRNMTAVSANGVLPELKPS